MNQPIAVDTADPISSTKEFQQALACYDARKLEEADTLVHELLQKNTDQYEVLHLAASVALDRYRAAEAVALFRRALVRAPGDRARGMSWRGLGDALRQAGDLPQAEDAYRHAMLCDPGIMPYAFGLSQALSDQGKFEPALELLRNIAGKHRRNPLPYWAIGTLLMQWNRQADALAAYELALSLDPGLSQPHVFAGAACQMLGRADDAVNHYKRALDLDPAAPAYCQLAQLKQFTADDPDLPRMEARLNADTAAPDAKIDAAFALAKAYDDIGDYDRAFLFLDMGNKLKRADVPYDVFTEEDAADRIMALFTRDFIARFENRSGSELSPIFILGMPRSGTTLVEQMLAAHSQIKAGGELVYISHVARELGEAWQSRGDAAPGDDDTVAADLRKGAARYAELTGELVRRHPRFTDKMPQNFMYIGVMHLLFPKAKIIHCRRDPIATCFSCYQRRFTAGNLFSFDLQDLGRFYKTYDRLMRHWHAVLPGRIFDVQYESVVADPEKEIHQVLDFCGLAFEAACLNFHSVNRAVATASNVQVRKPIYHSAIAHWRHYEKHLAPLIEGLQGLTG